MMPKDHFYRHSHLVREVARLIRDTMTMGANTMVLAQVIDQDPLNWYRATICAPRKHRHDTGEEEWACMTHEWGRICAEKHGGLPRLNKRAE